MLQLVGIKKNYIMKDQEPVRALRGVSLSFRRNEFVAILGPSGCGKTTLLNIIGGLDRYSDGDLIIKDKSTKNYKDHDWDTYRNHSVGFVFQAYNLIGHQSVLRNVELALTIGGVNRKERKERALQALERVGLKGLGVSVITVILPAWYQGMTEKERKGLFTRERRPKMAAHWFRERWKKL